jgi:hypothetical protein
VFAVFRAYLYSSPVVPFAVELLDVHVLATIMGHKCAWILYSEKLLLMSVVLRTQWRRCVDFACASNAMVGEMRREEGWFDVEETSERVDHFRADVVDHDDPPLDSGWRSSRRGGCFLRPFFQ